MNNTNDYSPNGRPLPTTQPSILASLGTTGTGQIRHSVSDLHEMYSEPLPGFLGALGADSTPQDQRPVPMLSENQFVLLGGDNTAREAARMAADSPRLAKRVSPQIASIAGSDGSGGSPALSLYFLEASIQRVDTAIQRTLQPFSPAELPATAARANAREAVRERGLRIASSGAVNLLFFLSLTGGTVGSIKYYLARWHHIAKGLQIPALNTYLFVTMAAPSPSRDPVTVHRLAMQYGRLQELVDNAERPDVPFDWEYADDKLFTHTGPLFDQVFLLPEPAADQLEAHHRKAGRLGALLAGTPLGKAFWAEVVNVKMPVSVKRGPNRRRKTFNRINFAELRATP